jgi:hypothetical protein
VRHTFLGARGTRPELVGMQCDPVRDARGKCVVSVRFAVDAQGKIHFVPRRRLRVNKEARQ